MDHLDYFRTRFKWVALWVFSILFLLTIPVLADEPYRLRIGDRAPDIELTRLEGGHLRFSNLPRRALAVTFYSPYCEPCRRELPILARVIARVGHDMGVDVKMAVIVSEGRPDVGVIEKLGSSVIWLLDDSGKAKSAFDPHTLPCTFIFGEDEVVRHINRGVGPQYETRVEGWLRMLASKKKRQAPRR
jgi:thiol-disulfide isomerase/thioredoxin